MRFSGKVALITGGTGGLGKAVSLAFLQEGARVIVTYQNPAELDALKGVTATNASSLQGESVDVIDEAAVRALVDKIIAQHARLDVLVNTVGGYAGGTKLWELDPKVFERMLALNLKSGFVLARAVVPAMLNRRAGAIVNISSKAAVDHAGGAGAYIASKSAALAMINSLAEDLRGTGVRANTVLPSIIDTESNRKAMAGADFAKWPKPEDIARIVLFLCSDEARVIHGAAIPVYGPE